MTISQTNASAANDLAQLLQTALALQTSSTSSSSSTQTSSTSSGADSTSVSGPGQLFSELEQLSKSNPSDFKTVTASISQELKSAASSATNSQQANFLNQMAANFATASQSGSAKQKPAPRRSRPQRKCRWLRTDPKPTQFAKRPDSHA